MSNSLETAEQNKLMRDTIYAYMRHTLKPLQTDTMSRATIDLMHLEAIAALTQILIGRGVTIGQIREYIRKGADRGQLDLKSRRPV